MHITGRLFRLAAFLYLIPAMLVTAQAGVFVSADRQVDTYQLLHEKLGGTPYEVPDCIHSEFGPHITQQFDNELGEDVFAFHLHVDHDNDRCRVFDRQRTEIKTYAASHSSLLATKNQIYTFEWQFKLDKEFAPATYFNHFFQLKPVEDEPGGNPVFTISARPGEPDELLFYQDIGNGMELLNQAPLEPFKGKWIDVRIQAQFSSDGFMEVQLKSTDDGRVLLDWRQQGINLWRSDRTRFVRPKWGNYRSLESSSLLRDETILFNAFCIAEAGESCETLETINRLQRGIASTRFEMEIDYTLDPFPSNRALPENNILSILRDVRFPGNGNARQSTRIPVTTSTEQGTHRTPMTLNVLRERKLGERRRAREKPRIIEILESHLLSDAAEDRSER